MQMRSRRYILLWAVIAAAYSADVQGAEPPALSAPAIEWAQYYYDTGKYDKAENLLTKKDPATAAEAYLLAKVYDRRQMRDDAIEMYGRAFELGNPEAAFQAALCERYRVVGADGRKALDWYRRGAAAGDLACQRALGFIYAEGETIGDTVIGHDDILSLRYYRMAAEQGDADAQAIVGDCFLDGVGTESDTGEALKWYERAAAQNQPRALYRIGEMYYAGSPLTPADRTRAKEYYERALASPDITASVTESAAHERLGAIHMTDPYTDYRKALKHLNAAVEATKPAVEHLSRAKANLAYIYSAGVGGVRQNPQKAFEILREACDELFKDETALYNLGKCYEIGFGTEADPALALKYYRMSAERGYRNAIDAVARLEAPAPAPQSDKKQDTDTPAGNDTQPGAQQ